MSESTETVAPVPQQPWPGRGPAAQVAGAALGFGLRAALALMLWHVRRAGSADHRFVAKGIGPRALFIVPAACLAMPLLWLGRRTLHRPDQYPYWMDDLLLSIVALDLAGNVFDLYDGYTHFDLIPHAHGTGALTVLTACLLDLPIGTAALLATGGHALLEAQEYASDRLFGYRNVRGRWDTIGDLAAGAAGTAIYGGLYRALNRRFRIGASGSGHGRARSRS